MNTYEVIAAVQQLVAKTRTFVDAWIGHEDRKNSLLIALAIVGAGAALVLSIWLIASLGDRLDTNRRTYHRGFRLAEKGETPTFENDAREMRHLERGWKDGLRFLATKRQKEETYRLQRAAVQKAVDAGDVSGALAIVDEEPRP